MQLSRKRKPLHKVYEGELDNLGVARFRPFYQYGANAVHRGKRGHFDQEEKGAICPSCREVHKGGKEKDFCTGNAQGGRGMIQYIGIGILSGLLGGALAAFLALMEKKKK